MHRFSVQSLFEFELPLLGVLLLPVDAVVSDGVLLLPDVHELSGDAPLLLALFHQPLHQQFLSFHFLPGNHKPDTESV